VTSPPDWATAVPATADVHRAPQQQATRPFTPQQMQQVGAELIEQFLKRVLLSIVGVFVPGTTSFEQLEEWGDNLAVEVAKIPIIGDIIEVITGVEDGDTGDLGTWVSDVLGWVEDLFNGAGNVPPTHLGDADINLLTNGDFATAASVQAMDGWSWDGTTGHLANGSAKLVADGTQHELVSNAIRVSEGQQLTVSVWEKHTSLTYSGSDPIAVGLITYSDQAGTDAGVVALPDIAAVGSPAATTSWGELSGGYTVPAGVKSLRFRLTVKASATSGTVWFDEGQVLKTVGVINDPHVPGIGNLMTNAILGLEDLTGVDINHDGVLGAYQTTAASLRANTTAIAWLTSLLTGGVSAVDDFERDDSNSMGSDWSQTYSGAGAGYMDTDGHACVWNASGWGARQCIARFTGTNSTSNTDTQKVLVVLGSKGQNSPLFSKCGYNYLYGRMSSDGTHYIQATFGADGEVALGYAAGGSYVQWATTDTTPPGNGSTLSLECGYGGDTRYYVAKINEQIILTWDESGTSSSMGASYRGWGCGMKAEGDILLLQQMNPAKINSWAGWDN
jgi:hypothetical protein